MVYTLTKTTPTNYIFKNETTKTLVKLITNDNVTFDVARECIPKFQTIEDVMGDGMIVQDGFPMPNVRSDQFIAILKFMIIDMERDPIPDIDEEKVQVPDGESREWWVGKARRENMRKHAISIPQEIWGTPLFLNRLGASICGNFNAKPAEYLNYQNFLFAWGKTMGEVIEPLSVDEGRKTLELKAMKKKEQKTNEDDTVVLGDDGKPVMEEVEVYVDAPTHLGLEVEYD